MLRSDVAKFFQPSIDCVVQAVMDQKQTARKDLSVRTSKAYITRSAVDAFLIRSTLSSSADSQLATGSLKESRQSWRTRVWSSYAPRTTCESGHCVHNSHHLIPMQEQSRVRRSHFVLPRSLRPKPRRKSHLRIQGLDLVRAQRSGAR